MTHVKPGRSLSVFSGFVYDSLKHISGKYLFKTRPEFTSVMYSKNIQRIRSLKANSHSHFHSHSSLDLSKINHLDIACGTGYYLINSDFYKYNQNINILLLDIEEYAVQYTRDNLISNNFDKNKIKCNVCDITKPDQVSAVMNEYFSVDYNVDNYKNNCSNDDSKKYFDSIALMGLLHCINVGELNENNLYNKLSAIIFGNGLEKYMNYDTLFYGRTILNDRPIEGNFSAFGTYSIRYAQHKKFFQNIYDNFDDANKFFGEHFDDVQLNMHGIVCEFTVSGFKNAQINKQTNKTNSKEDLNTW